MATPVPLLIARQQAGTALAGARGWLVIGFWSLLVLLACWSGAVAAGGERAAYLAGEQAAERAFADWRAAYEGDKYRPPQVGAEHPLVIHLPPAPARALASGAADAAGAWAQPTGYFVRELEGRKGELTPLGALFGALDPAGLVAVAGALLAIALGFDAVSGEKERGTLALHFANPIDRRTFLAGKVLGALWATAVALWLPLAVGVMALVAVGAIPATPGGLARAGAFGLAAFAYLAFWAAASVAASTLARSSAAAFVGLVGLWLVLAIAAPKVAVAHAANQHPVPAPAAFAQALQALRERANAAYSKRFDAWTATHKGPPAGKDLQTMRHGYFEGLFAAIDQAAAPHAAALERRQGVIEAAAALSPAFGFTLASAELAGTDGARHRAFIRAADRYAKELRLWPDRRAIAGATTRPTWQELPRPIYAEAASRALAPAFGRRMLWLLLALLVALGVAGWAFARYDLRLQGA